MEPFSPSLLEELSPSIMLEGTCGVYLLKNRKGEDVAVFKVPNGRRVRAERGRAKRSSGQGPQLLSRTSSVPGFRRARRLHRSPEHNHHDSPPSHVQGRRKARVSATVRASVDRHERPGACRHSCRRSAQDRPRRLAALQRRPARGQPAAAHAQEPGQRRADARAGAHRPRTLPAGAGLARDRPEPQPHAGPLLRVGVLASGEATLRRQSAALPAGAVTQGCLTPRHGPQSRPRQPRDPAPRAHHAQGRRAAAAAVRAGRQDAERNGSH
eukprot:29477-Rhodomonas_salina.3